jgi:transposase, IS5 family
VNDLAELLTATRQIVAQTRQRVAGHTSGDPAGEPATMRMLARQRRRDHARSQCRAGQSARCAATAPAVKRVKKRTGRAPATVTADRGHGEAKVYRQLTDLGVKNVVGPRKGKPSKARHADEHRKAFRRTIKWRTASEGRISYLKRNYGWDRTRIAGTEGARI